jgi:hypothetical protein
MINMAVYTNQLDEGSTQRKWIPWTSTTHPYPANTQFDYLFNSNEKSLIVSVPYEQSCVTAQRVG